MANWNVPTVSSDYLDVLDELAAKDEDAATMFLSGTETNQPVGSIRLERGVNRLQEWNGSSWGTLPLAVSGGGTSSTTAAGARSALGLGSIATQNFTSINITGGTISGVTISGLSATTAFSSGTVPTARLGSGLANSTTFLRGDQTWQAVTISPATWTQLVKVGVYTITVDEVNGKTIFYCNGTFTITLPAANNGLITTPVQGVRIVNIGTGVVTIATAAGTIIGAATFALDLQYMSLEVVPYPADNDWRVF